MTEPTTPAPPADELAKQLQSSLKRRRPRPWKTLVAASILTGAFLALLAWWMYPRRVPEIMQVLAIDAVYTPEETVSVKAQLLLPASEEDRRHLRGQTVVFFDQPLVGQGKPRHREAQTDANGLANVDWPLAPATTMEQVFVHYANVEYRQTSLPDTARLYVWPKDAKVLIVDADETLISEQPDDAAQTALQTAAEQGWHVVYLCLASTDANAFRVARGWVQNQARLPLGPVLGRSSYLGEETLDQSRANAIKALQARFRGPLAAVVKSPSAARATKELGLRTIMIGDADAPPSVSVSPTWADVPDQLK